MSHFNTSQRLFHLLCAPLLAFLPQAVISHNSDCRTHKFTGQHHLLLSIFAQLSGAASSIALTEELNDLDIPSTQASLRQIIGFDKEEFGQPLTLNQSSLSRANAHRSYRLWEYCFHKLWQTAKKKCQPSFWKGWVWWWQLMAPSSIAYPE